MPRPRPIAPRTRWRAVALAACSLGLLCAAQASAATTDATMQAGQSGSETVPSVGATLGQCVTSVEQTERAATFSGEMTAIPGTARMVLRIDLQERLRGEALFHTVSAPGLGVWRDSERKVKIYKSVQQVTNLSAPAVYRAWVRFRWLNAKGHVIRRAERFTPRCLQPASPGTTLPPIVEPSTQSSTAPASSS